MEPLGKVELHDLADGLLICDSSAIEKCAAFLLADTKGCWHGRARAMMSRRLKHCEIAPGLAERLVGRILERLATGDFSEQFRDQLRLAMRLDRARTLEAARKCLGGAAKEHVRRLAQWVVERG